MMHSLLKYGLIHAMIQTLVLTSHSLCDTFLASSGKSSDLISSSGARITPMWTYKRIFPAGHGYYWATTNMEVQFSSCLVAPNGSNVTDCVYGIFQDEIMRTTPKFSKPTQCVLFSTKILDGKIQEVVILENGKSYVLGHGYGHGRLLAIQEHNREVLLDVVSKKIFQKFSFDAIAGRGIYPAVLENGKWGIVNKEIDVILPAEYDRIICVGADEFHSFIIHKNGSNGLFSPIKGWIMPLSGLSFGKTDETGQFLIFKKHDKYGVINLSDGRLSIDSIYATITDISSRAAACIDGNCTSLVSLQTGESLVNGKFPFRLYLQYGGNNQVEIWVESSGKSTNRTFYIIGNKGTVLKQTLTDILPLGDFSSPNHDLLAFLLKDDVMGLMGVRSSDWETEIVPMQKELCIYPWWRHIKLRDASSRIIAIISTNSVVKLSPEVKATMLNDLDASGYARIVCDGKAGLVDGDCNFVLPCKYEDVGHFGEGLVPAKLDGKWGFVELPGKWVLPARFEEARSFKDGYAPVCIGGKWGFIDKSGKAATPFAYEDVKDVREGHFRAQVNGKWGIFALDGTCKLPAEYDRILSEGEYGYGDP